MRRTQEIISIYSFDTTVHYLKVVTCQPSKKPPKFLINAVFMLREGKEKDIEKVACYSNNIYFGFSIL